MDRREFIVDVLSDVATALTLTGIIMVVTFVFELQKYMLDDFYLYLVEFIVTGLYLAYMPCDGMLEEDSLVHVQSIMRKHVCCFACALPIHPTVTAALLTAVIIFAFGAIVVKTKADLTRLDSVRCSMQKIGFSVGILAYIGDSQILTACVLTYLLLMYLLFVVCDVQMTVLEKKECL